MISASKTADCEYTNFILSVWTSDESWVALVGDQKLAESQARDHFWRNIADRVSTELNTLENEGWQPVEPVGPQALKLRRSQSIEFSVNPADVMLWFMTLGIAFILQLFMNTPRRHVSYKPVEFRIKLARPIEHRLLTAA